jgi:hypothetical protein
MGSWIGRGGLIRRSIKGILIAVAAPKGCSLAEINIENQEGILRVLHNS